MPRVSTPPATSLAVVPSSTGFVSTAFVSTSSLPLCTTASTTTTFSALTSNSIVASSAMIYSVAAPATHVVNGGIHPSTVFYTTGNSSSGDANRSVSGGARGSFVHLSTAQMNATDSALRDKTMVQPTTSVHGTTTTTTSSLSSASLRVSAQYEQYSPTFPHVASGASLGGSLVHFGALPHPPFPHLDRAFVHHVLPPLPPIIATTSVTSSTSVTPSSAPPPPPPHPSPRESALSEDITRNLPEDLPSDLPVIDGDISKVIGSHSDDEEEQRRETKQEQPRQEQNYHQQQPHDQQHQRPPEVAEALEGAKSRKRSHAGEHSSHPPSPQLHRKQHRPNRQKLKMLGTKNSLSELYSSGGAGHL